MRLEAIFADATRVRDVPVSGCEVSNYGNNYSNNSERCLLSFAVGLKAVNNYSNSSERCPLSLAVRLG